MVNQKDLAPVSIIMPAYNCSKTISESIDSVINQTFRNWELIVVDDCSRDNTVEIVKKYQKKFNNIALIILKKNGGVGVCRNIGVNKARNDWIAFLDSDDLWEKNKLQKQISFIKKETNARLVFTGSSFIDNNGEKKKFVLDVPERVNYDQLLSHNIISCSSVLVKKEEMLKHPMPKDRMIHEDFVTWLSILKGGKIAYGIHEPLLVYRLSSGSKSRNKIRAAWMNWHVYSYMGIPILKIVILMAKYISVSLMKYIRLAK